MADVIELIKRQREQGKGEEIIEILGFQKSQNFNSKLNLIQKISLPSENQTSWLGEIWHTAWGRCKKSKIALQKHAPHKSLSPGPGTLPSCQNGDLALEVGHHRPKVPPGCFRPGNRRKSGILGGRGHVIKCLLQGILLIAAPLPAGGLQKKVSE